MHLKHVGGCGILSLELNSPTKPAEKVRLKPEEVFMKARSISTLALTRRRVSQLLTAVGIAALASATPVVAQDEPIKIGFSMAQTGNFAALGNTALFTMQMWADEVNARGGLLGRQVELVSYDDQSDPMAVPGIYTKLLDVDNVDLIVGPWATNLTAPAVPIAMQRGKTFLSIFSTGLNEEFQYDRYFSMIPNGPDAKIAYTEGFFALAAAQDPAPKTVAIVAADTEAAQLIAEGARINAEEVGLQIVYDRAYPPNTSDYTSIIQAVKATNPDVVLLSTGPVDGAGLVRATNEVGFKPGMIGGAMMGLPSPIMKAQLGPLLNGFMNTEFWLPQENMTTPASLEFIERYRERAAGQNVDQIGLYVPPWAYSYMQVLEQAVEIAGSLDDDAIAAAMRDTTFQTVAGEVKFGADGEWAESRLLQVQYEGIEGNEMGQFSDLSTVKILWPEAYQTGELTYPFNPE